MSATRATTAMLLVAAMALLPQSARAASVLGGSASPNAAAALGDYVLLGWNDLGMHCMNQNHAKLSVLPPYNNQYAQLIKRGSAGVKPQVVTTGFTVNYSIPGNTYSVGKTDFWTYSQALFGVTLPPNVGLTGKGLSGLMDPAATYFVAEGIPVTPFPDATPTVENAYQQSLLVAHDANGVELAHSTPTIPVSVELSCVSSGCHSSESAILSEHEHVSGFNPSAGPILCAKCHADPVLGTTGTPSARYFSYRMHEKHTFIDQRIPGIDGCYKCHPGPNAKCLRGAMADKHGMICQDCHGNMETMASSISNGRIPWVNEPRCGTCHLAQYAEPVGQLYRKSAGHGGVMCEACHGSTHGEYPSRRPEDNANSIALQGHAGVIGDCTVCHGVTPAGAGPHGIMPVGVAENQLLGGAGRLQVSPNPTRGACLVRVAAKDGADGRMLVFDVNGRTVRLLRPTAAGSGVLQAAWDGTDQLGRRVGKGVYFIRWAGSAGRAAGKVMIVD
jgi:hypothetical protein